MTNMTRENIEIQTVADVEAIDDNTNNRLAVRSLRHAADRAMKRSVRKAQAAESGDFSNALPDIRCAASGRSEWRDVLVKARADIDNLDASPEVRKAQLLEQAAESRKLAAACLDKAIAIIDAHPEGLPESEPTDSDFDDEDAESLED